MRQTVRLDAESARLEFHCEIDWHEDRRALKVRFPVAVHAPRATYEMQFGVVERPTHYSTRRDLAQFEVPGHRFADLSEHGFGVALLSAATYGWSVHGGDMRMTLLRSPRWPDPEADIGHHELAFAIQPHRGGWQDAGVTAEALCFNAPLLLGEPTGETRSWFSTDAPGLFVDTVKRAEDGDELIVRLYEAHGGARHRPPARRRAVRRGVVHQPPGGPPRPGRGRGRRDRHPLPPVRDRDARARCARLDSRTTRRASRSACWSAGRSHPKAALSRRGCLAARSP